MKFLLPISILLSPFFLLSVTIAGPSGGIPIPPSKDVIQLQEDVAELQGLAAAQQAEIATLQSDLTAALARISTNETSISTLQSDVSSNFADITTLQAQIGATHWVTSTGIGLTSSDIFADIPNTFVAFETEGEPRDMTIHFCAQIDNVSGGRTMMRVNVDGVAIAEPDLAPGPILSWDKLIPTTECMMWVAPQVVSGPHVISVQWMHDLGGTESRISYRTLAVYY